MASPRLQFYPQARGHRTAADAHTTRRILTTSHSHSGTSLLLPTNKSLGCDLSSPLLSFKSSSNVLTEAQICTLLSPRRYPDMASKRFGLLVFVFGVLLCQQSLVSGEEDSLAFVKKTVREQHLVIFSKSYCPYCKRAKAIFAEMNEKPYVVELDEREDGGAIQQALSKFIGRSTVPQVFINGEHIGGSDDTVAAHRNGRLVKLLKKNTTAQKEQSRESEL